MRAFFACLVTVLLVLIAVAPSVSAEPPRAPALPYRIVVHPTNPITSIDRTFLQYAFLKKKTRWPGEKVIHPADLTASSVVRSKFSEEVIGRSVKAVKAYWQQRIFSGRDIPPPEFEADEQVIAFVLKNEGAIGYVSGTVNLSGAKAVPLTK